MDAPGPFADLARSTAGPAVPVARRPSGNRLFRRYFVLILALVTAALLIPSSISLYFSYRETLDVLHALQREKAVAAAGRIEQYILQVQAQLKGAALPQLGSEGAEQRRLEFLKLLKQVPDVTDIAWIGADGCEKSQVSRLAMDAAGECLRDRSRDPAFLEPTAARPWYGRVTFRKETEPYMQIAVRPGGDAGPVTVADVNLKFMWDVISRIKVGEKGKAYVVDTAGYLIADPDIGLVLRKTDLSGLAHVEAALAGTGAEAFCSGGDQRVRGDEGYIDEGGTPHLNVLDLQMQIRRLPKPVVAMVAGYAVGGGHVLHLVCDLTIAAENARFGQTGPRVGSFDAGLGAGLLARTIGVKRAKEIWFLCRQYDAAQALDWGLVNAVVPVEMLEEETVAWCKRMLDLSPMALRMIKAGFNADTDGLAGIQELAGNATGLFYMTAEGQEGRDAWLERRPPDFSPFRKRP